MINKDENERLNKACSSFLNLFFIITGIMLIIAFIFTRLIVENFLVAGWTDKNNIELTVILSRILLLQVLFMTLSAVFGSYLNSLEKFFSYSLAILSYNVGIIFGILFIAPFAGIQGVVWGAVLGGFIHFSIQMIGSFKNGFKYSFSLPKFDSELKGLFKVAVPRIIAISADQLVRFVLIAFASFIFTGSMIIFDNVENVGMVFYGMLAISVSTTAFPGFIKLFNEGKYDALFRSFLDKLRFMFFFMIPASVIMIVFRNDIIELLFRYGKFNPIDRALTSDALFFYTIGIPFLSLTILTVKYYYAMKKSLLPMIAALSAISVTVISSYFLSAKYDVSGLAAGRSAGFIVQALILIGFIFISNSQMKIKLSAAWKSMMEIAAIIASSAVMLAAGILLHRYFNFSTNTKINSIISVAVIGSVISLMYISFCMLFKNPDIFLFVNKFKRLSRMKH
jgi:putative peptidoglycan lipid II flippase